MFLVMDKLSLNFGLWLSIETLIDDTDINNYDSYQKYIQTISMIRDKNFKQIKTDPNKTNNKMAIMRLKKDLSAYQSQAADIDFVKLTFPDPQIIQNIQITIFPQDNSPYNKTQINFSLSFPDAYPIQPPKLKCLNKIFHPNINYNGSVCLPLVREDWSPTTSLFSIVCGLIFILTYPSHQDPLEPEIGKIIQDDKKIYEKIVSHTIQGRMYHGKDYDNIVRNSHRIEQQVDQFNAQC